MTAQIHEKESITFKPNLFTDDALANYWMRQVTVRLRREICWIWQERGIAPDLRKATPPPFVDRVSASVDMVRYWEEKNTERPHGSERKRKLKAISRGRTGPEKPAEEKRRAGGLRRR